MANDSTGKSKDGDDTDNTSATQSSSPDLAPDSALDSDRTPVDPLIREGVTALVECSTDLVALTTLDQRMTFLNAAGMRLVGLPNLAAVRNTIITDYFGEEVADRINSDVVPAVMATGSWQGILNMRHFQTGARIPVFFNSTLVRDPATGEPIGMGTVGREVTALQQAEQARQAATAALEKLNQELEERIQHRTAELQASNEQLALANQDLSRATRLKDEFLATMSHELRTPLSSILGMVQALRREIYGPLCDRQHHALGIVERSGRHLLALINDVLDLAKIEAGRMDLRLTTVALADLCETSLAFVQQQAQHKQIQLALFCAEDLTHVEADELRLKQALINLLDNAVKFTPRGGQVTLTVELDQDLWEPAHVVFTVADTGVGISSTDYDRLFESFVQLDSSLTREYGGTGLGLALVKQIATMHGGSISVVSTPGQGSQFMLRLPSSHGTLSFPSEATPAGDQPLPLQLIPHPAHILVAEDDPANRNLLLDVLQSLQYIVTTACNGREAIQKALDDPPDLIVMDVQMPGIDGLEAMRQIRSHANLSHCPIIALTALVMPGDRDRCLRAGATAYMAKPLSMEGFTHLIQHLLQTTSALPKSSASLPHGETDQAASA